MALKPRYIVVEGPIGVGKTSLARLLARVFNSRLILEDVSANPFLSLYYKDMRKYAFQTQIAFLVARAIQQRELVQDELFTGATVSDYLFAKDRIFASITLDEHEFALYEKIYRLFDSKAPNPDLVVYLRASPELLLQRLQKRGRDYEKSIDLNYLEQVVRAFNEFFFNYSESPLLVVDTTDIDFVENPGDFSDLLKEIQRTKSGVLHYIPRKRPGFTKGLVGLGRIR